MSYTCDTQPRTLPLIEEPCLIINQGTADIILGDDSRMIKAYGTHIVPGANLIYDLSSIRYICSVTGAQNYDILPGGGSSIPGAANIANAILASGLAADIATDVVNSGLSLQIAQQVLATGTKVIDVPQVIAFGPIDGNGFPFTGSAIFDVTDAQSLTIAFNWQNVNASNLSSFGAINVIWFDTAAGTNQIGLDTYEIAGDLNAPGTALITETGYIRTPCLGAAVQVQFQPTPVPGGAGRVFLRGIIVKSYRLNPINRYATDASADRVLGRVAANGVAAGGASVYLPCSPYDGPLEINGDCSACITNETYVQYGWGSTQWPVVNTAGRTATTRLYFPSRAGATTVESLLSAPLRASSRRPLWMRIHNGEAGGRDFSVTVIASTLA